jgi:hypothetical protein
MPAKFRFGWVVAAFLAFLCPGLSLAQTPAACPADATALTDGAKLSCTCAAGASGGVYGSSRYTADSSICAAAIHAGKVPASGGAVNIVVGGACASFTGTSANSVTTTSWSSYDKTFGFDALPACAVAAAPAAPPASTAGGVADCPSFIGQSDKSKPGDKMTCVCPANIDFSVGAAYGTDRYSHDSPICMSAKHAGKLPQPGATITVYVAEGCGKFEGTARNDITTRSWGSATPGTIAFVTPPPPCVAPAGAPAPTTATAPRPPTAPAGPNPMIAWEARAKAYAAALPAPLPGWEAQPLITRVQNSAIAGREVSAYRIYRIGFHPVGLNSVTASIYNNPDGTAAYPIEIWNSEAKRKEAGATMVKLAGRDAMETKSAGGTTNETGWTLSFMTKNNLFVTVSWQEPHMTRDKAIEYVKALDFTKIEALVTK